MTPGQLTRRAGPAGRAKCPAGRACSGRAAFQTARRWRRTDLFEKKTRPIRMQLWLSLVVSKPEIQKRSLSFFFFAGHLQRGKSIPMTEPTNQNPALAFARRVERKHPSANQRSPRCQSIGDRSAGFRPEWNFVFFPSADFIPFPFCIIPLPFGSPFVSDRANRLID